ncbi:MAG: PASTA domain-containing protein [Bacteroidetes bacterium]|nr:PASTA domain-containing protein [Bacteroidota bacterium]
MLKKLLILFGIIVIIIFLFNNILMPLYVKHSELVKVPGVIGLDYLNAKRIVEENGLEVKQVTRFDETRPIGQIIDQNPPAEQMVKDGRRIYLVVCGGEQLMQVPKLSGRTVRDAKFTLEQRNLMVGEIVKKFSNEYDDNVVITQIVQPGSLVKRNTKIDLIVSNGPRIGDLIIPDLVGKTLTEAKKILIDGKLKLGKVTYQTSDQPPGKIVDQYPKKDKSAKETTEVDVFVSKEKIPDEFEYEEEETGIDGNIEEDIEPDNSNRPTPDVETPKDKKEKDTKDKDDSKSDNL